MSLTRQLHSIQHNPWAARFARTHGYDQLVATRLLIHDQNASFRSISSLRDFLFAIKTLRFDRLRPRFLTFIRASYRRSCVVNLNKKRRKIFRRPTIIVGLHLASDHKKRPDHSAAHGPLPPAGSRSSCKGRSLQRGGSLFRGPSFCNRGQWQLRSSFLM